MKMNGNIFADIPMTAPEELTTDLLRAENVRIERIVSFGQASPDGFWYEQEENEWVLLLEGAARVGFEDRVPVELGAGEHLHLPAGCRHRVEWTSEETRTVWLAVFYR
jgi:cupin 2 domain-containing protein